MVDRDPVLAYWVTGGIMLLGAGAAFAMREPPRRRATMREITVGALSDAARVPGIARVILYSIGVFAYRFNGFSGERFEVLGEQPARRGSVLVKNQIVKSDGEAIAINYLAQPQDDGSWRIVDTILGGISSELASRRKEYIGIISKTGVVSLIQALNDKTAAFAEE